MRGVSMSLAGVLTLGVIYLGAPARADEAYVCEGGRIAYVRFGQLEAMKRSDPCIAAHHRGADSPELAAADAADGAAVTARDGEIAEVVLVAGGGAQPATAPALKQAPKLARRPQTAPAKLAASGGTSGRIVERAPPTPPVPHPDTDFRNVKVINAAPGTSEIFRHDR